MYKCTHTYIYTYIVDIIMYLMEQILNHPRDLHRWVPVPKSARHATTTYGLGDLEIPHD